MATFKYRAFLSYSHRDAALAKWLHRALETYRIDKDLIGRPTPSGPVPKTLRPIFRDREDFSAGHSLNEQTTAALDASQFLVAICSPNATSSKYVNEEIRHFKACGGAARVIPLIIDGEPGDPQRECFPPAIRFKLGAAGEVTDERDEPIAADARPQADGKEIAKQKVVAGLLGIGLDEIMRRAERARKRRNRWRIGLAGAASTVIATGVVGWWWAVGFSSQLSSSSLLTIKADAADICQRASERAAVDKVPEARRIAFAVKCVTVLTTGIDEQSQGIGLPVVLTTYLERELAILNTAKDEGKLTREQIDALAKAEILLARAEQQ